jgi:predicted Zn-dependent protease
MVTKIVGGRVIATRPVDPDAYEHAARALLYEEEERFEDAINELKRAVNHDNDAPELHARMAELYLKLDRPKEAAEAVKQSLELGESVDGLIADAHVRQQRGDQPGAVASLRRAAALSSFTDNAPEATAAHLELADAQLLALEPEGARATLRALADAAPASTVARVRLGALAWALGAPGEAEARLREALADEPNQIDALLTLGSLQAAQGKGVEARARFREALDRSEGALEVAIPYARLLVGLGDLAEAAQVADDLTPGADDTTLFQRIDLERAAKRVDHALGLARGRRAAADASEDLRARLDLIIGDILDDGGKHGEAQAVLLGVPKSAAAFGEARLRAAASLREQGKTAEAARVLGEALGGAANEALRIEVAVAQALTDERAGAAAQAVRRLDELLAKKPESSRLLLAKAALLERQGKWKEALSTADRVLKEEPGNTEALNFWGFVAADNGHELARASARIRTAFALEPGSGAILDSLGWAHFRAGELTQAAAFLEQAGRLEPEDPEILGHLAEMYGRRGERARAEKALRKALGGKPEEPLKHKLEQLLQNLLAGKS